MKTFIKKQLEDSDRITILELKKNVEMQRSCQFKLAPDFVDQADEYIRHLLCFHHNQLVAYACLSFYDENELEVTLITQESSHILKEVMDKIIQITHKKQRTMILFITDPKDEFLQASFALNDHLKKQFTEYRLVLHPAKFMPMNSPVVVRKAQLDESIAIAQLQFGTEDFSPSALLSEDLEKTFVLSLENQLIACVRIDETPSSYGIYGFVVDPKFRGQGLGKAFLNSIIQQLLLKKEKEIYLEVDSTNVVAYELYVNMGFEKKSTFDYYEQQVIN